MNSGLNLLYLLIILVVYDLHKCAADPLINEQDCLKQARLAQHRSTSGNDDNKCGGVLEIVDEQRTLSYKMEKPTDRYENCMWIIYSPKKSQIYIQVPDPLYYSHMQFLSIGHFINSTYDQQAFFKWQQISYSTVVQSLTIPGPVAFVHYSSQFNEPMFGFRLNYWATGQDFSWTSVYKYENYFVQGEYGSFRYPGNNTNYGPNKRLAVVVQAYDKIEAELKQVPKKIHILNKGIENSGNCTKDSLNLFGYGTGQKTWFRNATLCSGWTSNTVSPPKPIFIITFQSDGSGTGSGFDVKWMDSSY